MNHPSFCDGVFPTITLTASGGSGNTLKWYSGSCGGAPVGSGASLTIPAPSSSTTYFARWESGTCGSTTCVSVNVHVDPSAHAPTSINASANNYCSGSVTSLTLTAVGGSGSTLQWFDGACGSSPIGTGNPLTIAAPTVSKTYFARWSNTTCGPSSCVSIAITVNPATGACCTGWGNQKDLLHRSARQLRRPHHAPARLPRQLHHLLHQLLLPLRLQQRRRAQHPRPPGLPRRLVLQHEHNRLRPLRHSQRR